MVFDPTITLDGAAAAICVVFFLWDRFVRSPGNKVWQSMASLEFSCRHVLKATQINDLRLRVLEGKSITPEMLRDVFSDEPPAAPG